MKQFDGDYDVMYHMVKDSQMPNGKTFQEVLSESVGMNQINKVAEANLNLNIKIPALKNAFAGTWDTQKYSPLVGVKTLGQNVAAFDGTGKKYVLSTLSEPDNIVIIIENSERIKVRTMETFRDDILQGIITFKPKPSVLNGRNHRQSWPSWWNEGCPRDNSQAQNQRNLFSQVYIDTNAWGYGTDGWTEGNFELSTRLITAKTGEFDNQNLGVASIPRYIWRNHPQLGWMNYGENINRWYSIGAAMPVWDKTIYGDRWKLRFVEKDNGATVSQTITMTSNFTAGIKLADGTFNAGFNGAITRTGTYTYTDADEDLGEVFVYYCDKLGPNTNYPTSSIQVQVAMNW